MNDKKAIQQLSIDAKMIYDQLIIASVGDTVTYAELTSLIGRDVQQKGRGALITARRRARNIDRIIFGTVRDSGLLRLNDTEIVETGEGTLRHIRRAARRGAQKVLCVQNFNSLPNEKKIQHNTFVSMFGVMAEITKPNKIKAIEKRVESAQAVLPVAKMMEELRSA